MRKTLLVAFLAVLSVLSAMAAPVQTESVQRSARRNVIIFVADGLRHGSVNERDTPTLWMVRSKGVHFENSYSVFPTFTTANASAIATGHYLGDTGDFSNTLWLGYPTFDTGNFGLPAGTPIPFLENNQMLADIDDHYRGNYLGEETFLQIAREHGYNTAAVGKLGPSAIQDAAAIAPNNGSFPMGPTIIVDDLTGTASGIPLPQPLLMQLQKEKLVPEAPSRSNGFGTSSQFNNGYSGDNTKPGTLMPNVVQQQWLVDVTTRGIFALFESNPNKPFALVFWSRDPDATQHNQGDSLGTLSPGINGETSLASVKNADHTLQQLLDWLGSHPAVRDNTDIFVTSDHGFATISRREIDIFGHPTASEAAHHYYLDTNGRVETEKGTLPNGFLAIDLALGLHTNLFDPDRRVEGARKPYRRVRLEFDTWEHPAFGNGLLGNDIERPDGSDAKVIVAANGGSDLIYVPDGSAETVRSVVRLLLTFDYLGGVFVDDKFGSVPGTLPLSAINLVGASAMPRPSIVVAFKVFYLDPADLQTAIQIADTSLQEGQGMHGGLGRDSSYNNMAVIGPDFKQGYIDPAPVSNADIVPTLVRLLGLPSKPKGKLLGRVLEEALRGQSDATAPERKVLAGTSGSEHQTVLEYQEYESRRYIQSACLLPATQTGKQQCR